jgi:hypothetical protein
LRPAAAACDDEHEQDVLNDDANAHAAQPSAVPTASVALANPQSQSSVISKSPRLLGLAGALRDAVDLPLRVAGTAFFVAVFVVDGRVLLVVVPLVLDAACLGFGVVLAAALAFVVAAAALAFLPPFGAVLVGIATLPARLTAGSDPKPNMHPVCLFSSL